MVGNSIVRGLLESLRIGSFRYNQHFQEFESSRFMVDLFNNPNVRYILNNVKNGETKIKLKQ